MSVFLIALVAAYVIVWFVATYKLIRSLDESDPILAAFLGLGAVVIGLAWPIFVAGILLYWVAHWGKA